MLVTPQVAAQLLRHRPRNRPISRSYVRQLMETIRAGRFVCNGEPILVDTDGEDGTPRLVDGQHRLMAIQESGIAVEVLVVAGPLLPFIVTIDQGRGRSVSDVLAASGLKSTKVLAGACAWVARFEQRAMRQATFRLANAQVLDFVVAHPGLSAALVWGKRCKGLVPGSLASALAWLMTQRDAPLAEQFWHGLASGLQLDAESPVHVVRQRLIREKKAHPRHLDSVSTAAALVLAFNCLKRGHRLPSGLVWKGVTDPDTAFPELL
jgi:hypothetical protein